MAASAVPTPLRPTEVISRAKSEYGAGTKLWAQGFYNFYPKHGHWGFRAEDAKKLDGACYGLSLYWVRCKKEGKDFFRLIGEEIEPTSQLKNARKKFQRKQERRDNAGYVTEFMASQTPDEQLVKERQALEAWQILPRPKDGGAKESVIEKVRLADFLDAQDSTADARARAIRRAQQKAAELIVKYDNSWVMIHVSDHSMAARIISGKVEFFDPNGGEAVFPDRTLFRDWFADCWTLAYPLSYIFFLQFYVG